MPATRRRVLGGLAAGAVAAAGLGGCSPAAPARPTAGSGAVSLRAILDIPATDQLGSRAERDALYREVLAAFTAKHHGIEVRIAPYVSTSANVAAIIAGTAADVFADTAPSYAAYVQQHLLLALTPYLRRDAVNPAIWSSTVWNALLTPTGTYALSRGLDSYVLAVDLGAADRAGLAYPSTDWTHTEFAAFATALSGTAAGGQHRYGVGLQGGPGGFLGGLQNPVVGFGGAVTNGARTRQTLSAPAALAGAHWLLAHLLWPRAGIINTGAANLTAGTAAIEEIQQVDLLFKFQQWQQNFKWTLYPPPVYPKGRVGGAAANFWAVSGTTRHPEEAWAFIRWLTVDPTYQVFLMKTFLFPPAVTALLAQWQGMVEAVAPGLRGKGLQWFTAGAAQGWGRAEPYFAYANTQAIGVDAPWWSRILQQTVSAAAGLTQADAQVNALQAAAAAQAPVSLASIQAAQRRQRAALQRMFAAGG